MGQHLLLKVLQRWTGIDAEFVGEMVAQLVIRRQRVRWPAASIEGDDSLAVQPFVKRIAGHQLVELAEHGRVPAERQFGIDLGLNGCLAPIGQSGRHWQDELEFRHIG